MRLCHGVCEAGMHDTPQMATMEGQAEGPAAVQVTTFDKAARSETWNGDNNEYVMHLARSCDCSTTAAALSNQSILVYDRESLTPRHQLRIIKAHSGVITDLCFSPATPHLLASSSEDGTIKTWDVRTGGSEPTGTIRLEEGVEALCCSMGLGGDLIAVGAGTRVLFYDVRNLSAQLGVYGDVHTDDVTKLLFHPTEPTRLASGAEDGLICFYDVGVGKADEALLCIVNAECPVRQLTFFGPRYDGLAVLTGTDGLSLWHWPTAKRIADLGDIRSASEHWAKKAHYAISCHYDAGSDDLYVSAANETGHLTLARVLPTAVQPVRELTGGHSAVVRAVDYYMPNSIVSGGEDARLCLWNGQAPVRHQQQQGGDGGVRGSSLNGAVKAKIKHKPYKPF